MLPSIDNVLAWRSLLHGELRLHPLAIDGPRLSVRRDAAGALYVAGMKLGGGAGGAGFERWLLGQSEIVVRNAEIEWRDELRGAPPLALTALDLRLRNCRASATRSACPRGRRPSSARASSCAPARRPPSSPIPRPGRGALYAELGYTDLAAWRAWVDYPVDIRAGPGRAARLGRRSKRGELRRATADRRARRTYRRASATSLRRSSSPRCSGRLQGAALRRRLPARGARPRARRRATARRWRPADFDVTWTTGSDAGGTLAASGDRARAARAPRRVAAAAGRGAPAPRRARAARPARRRALRMAAASRRRPRASRRARASSTSPPSRSTSCRGSPASRGSFDATEASARMRPRHAERRARPAARVSRAAHRARFPERPGRVGAPGRRRRRAAHSVAHVLQRAPERQRASAPTLAAAGAPGTRRPFGAASTAPTRRSSRATSRTRASWAARRRASGL